MRTSFATATSLLTRKAKYITPGASELVNGGFYLDLNALTGDNLIAFKSPTTDAFTYAKITFSAIAPIQYTFNTHIRPILGTFCGPCHGPGASQESIFAADVYQNASQTGGFDKRERIKIRLLEQLTMPPVGSPAPSNIERGKIAAWIMSGAPQ